MYDNTNQPAPLDGVEFTASTTTTETPPAETVPKPTLDQLAAEINDAISHCERVEAEAKATLGAAKKSAKVTFDRSEAEATATFKATVGAACIAAGQKLLAARDIIDATRKADKKAITWTAWVKANVAYSDGYVRRLMATARSKDPKKAHAASNAKTAAGMAKHRAAGKPAATGVPHQQGGRSSGSSSGEKSSPVASSGTPVEPASTNGLVAKMDRIRDVVTAPGITAIIVDVCEKIATTDDRGERLRLLNVVRTRLGVPALSMVA